MSLLTPTPPNLDLKSQVQQTQTSVQENPTHLPHHQSITRGGSKRSANSTTPTSKNNHSQRKQRYRSQDLADWLRASFPIHSFPFSQSHNLNPTTRPRSQLSEKWKRGEESTQQTPCPNTLPTRLKPFHSIPFRFNFKPSLQVRTLSEPLYCCTVWC